MDIYRAETPSPLTVATGASVAFPALARDAAAPDSLPALPVMSNVLFITPTSGYRYTARATSRGQH